MAGYVQIGNGRYDGAHKVGTIAIESGSFVELNASGYVVVTAAAKNTIMQVEEKTTLWGKKAVVLRVKSVAADEVFFAVPEWDVNENTAYDEANYSIKPGEFCKMHRPEIGDKLIVSVSDALYATLAVLDNVQPAATGTIAKV